MQVLSFVAGYRKHIDLRFFYTRRLSMSESKSVYELNHYRVSLPHGGKIVILDSGAVLSAEATAMLQALHSRSTDGIDSHLQILAERGPEKFMSTYYVGYGHKSIGDCGTAIVFIEGVSMLAAKAIQDSKLYNGQESSTRYIPFEKQPFINPLGTDEGAEILERWRAFYLKTVVRMKEALLERYPIEGHLGEKEAVYQKAIGARAFDICRAFLPAGAATNLAWSGTLRQFADRLGQLRHHPLKEVRDVAHTLEDALIATYPNSFDAEKKRYAATEAYVAQTMDEYYYHNSASPHIFLTRDSVDHVGLGRYSRLLQERPPKTELPKWLGVYGEAAFAFTLDFGSFRDIQRHRAVTQRMPLLTGDIGFHPWYLDELTEDLRNEAHALIAEETDRAKALTENVCVRQYYLPMGFLISNYLAGDLPALVYLIEQRATSLVHPTLAIRAREMATLLQDTFSDVNLTLHVDPNPGRFNVKRGTHDIVKKNS